MTNIMAHHKTKQWYMEQTRKILARIEMLPKEVNGVSQEPAFLRLKKKAYKYMQKAKELHEKEIDDAYGSK